MALNLEAGVEPVAGYSLVRRLGRGGFGEVWEAVAPRGVRVALKFIRLDTDQAGPELRALEVIRNIRHPHLLDVQFAVQVDDCLVIAMPLCDQSLLDRLRASPAGLPRDELLRFMGELAEAIDFLNEPRHPAGEGGGLVGIQHRDIKPHNVFLVGGSARLADFGLAKILEKDAASHTGSMSPAYVAPEVLEGRVSRWTDQYSLAVTYFQLRTGRPLFEGPLSAVVSAHLHRPPDLSRLPDGERSVLARALAKRPEERWPSCGAFVSALEAAIRADDARPAEQLTDTMTLPPRPDASTLGADSELPCETLIAADSSADPSVTGRKGHGRPQRPVDRRSPRAGNAPPPGWDRSPPLPRSIPRRGKRVVWGGLGLAVLGLAGMLLMTRTVGFKAARSRPPLVIARGNLPKASPPATAVEPNPEPARTIAAKIRTPSAEAPTRAAQVKEIFQAHCLECHGGKKTKAKVKILDRDLLVKQEKVIPARPDDSELFLLVTADDESVMPPPDQPRLTAEEIETIRAWIAEGAPAFPVVGTEPVKTIDTEPAAPKAGVDLVLKAILQDVRSLPAEDRRFARYFSLNHLLAGGASPEEMELHREALTKAINHLSWQQALVRAQAIEPTRTVFRIDFRSLGWHQRPFERIVNGESAGPSPLNLFDLALLEYPYGVIPEDSETFDQLTTEYLEPAGLVRPIPFVRADWFVSTATQPPLYEDFLQLPFTLKELELRLNVDVDADLLNNRARRAGMAVSDVSRNNRAVERHPAPFGAYWKSLDFRTSKAQENLFRDPLNLNPAGGEIIFNLPNGLQAYALADARGNRLDVAPTEIVTDKFAEDKAVRNGLSCIRCHDLGMKHFVDTVRSTVEKLPGSPGFDKAKVLQLYPEQAEMDRLLKEDAARFASAMREALGKPPGKEPLIGVSKRYLEEPLTLTMAAAELGLTGSEEVRGVFRTPALAGLGLSPLAAGGTVRRDTWEDSFDRVVRALGLGVPIVPIDALTRPDHQPDGVDLDVKLGTNKKNNVFAPGDELVITVTNSSAKDVFIELVGTSARGKKVILAPSPTKVPPGGSYRFPPEGAIKVRGNLGKERITVFASDAAFPAGELLRGQDVVDRVVHPFDRPDRPGPRQADPARMLKKTIEIETR